MITIFNRKELLITYSLNEQATVCDILNKNNIKCKVKVINRQNSNLSQGSRASGSLGINLDNTREYIIYVAKKDFENARFLSRKKH